MSRLEELYAKVYAAPDDLELRLVLGDALLEIGDPRGEYISLQHTRSSPEREKELFERHHIEWLGNLAPAALYPEREAKFELGFPSKLMYSRTNGEATIGMREWSTVHTIDVHSDDKSVLRLLWNDLIRRHARRILGIGAIDFVEVASSIEPFAWNRIDVIYHQNDDRIANAFDIYRDGLPHVRSIGFQGTNIRDNFFTAKSLARIVETKLFAQLEQLFIFAPQRPWPPEVLNIVRAASKRTRFQLATFFNRIGLTPSGEMTLSLSAPHVREELIDTMDALLDDRVRVIKVRCEKDQVDFFEREIQARNLTMELLP